MERPEIAVAHPIPDAALKRLEAVGDVRVGSRQGPIELAELAEAARGADALITLLYDRVDAQLLDSIEDRRLKVIANVAVGYDNFDVSAIVDRGVIATNTPGVLTDATADLTMSLILAVTRRVGEGERLIRTGATWSWDLDFMLGSGLQGKTLGIVGLGSIGSAVARRARSFGMKIAYSNRRPVADVLAKELGARYLDFDDLVVAADVLSLHCPLTDETRHLVDGKVLRRMRPNSYLVNTARGPIVDETALVEALEQGWIRGAALDVFEHEPTVHPGLVGREDVVLLPHLGSATVETRTAMAELAAENVIAVLEGRRPPTPVGLPDER